MLLNLSLGLFFSAIIAGAAFLRGSLAPTGVLGAILLGTLVFGAGGLSWAILLVAFFVSSSLLSHYKSRRKESLAEKFQKGHRRDLGQVLANGGAGGLCALAFALSPQPIFFIAFLGAIAAVTADTWATELGVLSARLPRMITNGRLVAPGTSGAITSLGTLVGLSGAAFIGIIAAVNNPLPPQATLSIIIVAVVAGVLGSFLDSFLGATVQGIYHCEYDQQETEARVHRCGRAARHTRGWHWLDNDGVNFIASVGGGLIAAALFQFL